MSIYLRFKRSFAREGIFALNKKKAEQAAVEGRGRHLGQRMVVEIVEGLRAGGNSRHII